MNTLRKKIFWAIILICMFVPIAKSLAEPSPSWGQIKDGLRIGVLILSEAQNKSSSKIVICLENVSTNSLVLNIGTMLANGKIQLPTAIKLQVTDSQGGVHDLKYISSGAIGRVDPFVVPLSAGSMYWLRCASDDFAELSSSKSLGHLQPGEYHLTVIFTGRSVEKQTANADLVGLSLMPYWTGTLSSGVGTFSLP